MASITMEAAQRSEVGKGANRRLRAAGKIPGVLYGEGKETVSLTLDPKELIEIIRSHGGVNTIFELKVDGAKGKGKENVMITDYQLEPVEHRLLHADLKRVAMDKELTLDVAVEIAGVPVGVKVGGGMLDFITRTVEVACLPKDIPETLVVEVSELDMGDYVRASDLQLPAGVRLISEPNVVIAHVMTPKAEIEETPEEGEEAAAAGEPGAEGEGEGAGEGEAKPASQEGEGDKG